MWTFDVKDRVHPQYWVSLVFLVWKQASFALTSTTQQNCNPLNILVDISLEMCKLMNFIRVLGSDYELKKP